MEINHITFAYRDKVTRLHDISARIRKGEITTIIGPNGCGKSTLMGVLTNNLSPQKGTIVLDGKAINTIKPKELALKLGVVHQQNTAPDDMTVEKLVTYGRLPHRKSFSPLSEKDEEMIEWAMKRTGIFDRRDMTIDSLSGGQQQRVWIAMALAQDTPYLFLDEPTSNLDMYYQYGILDLVKELRDQNELTIVMVLHDINQAIQYSDQIIAMKAGKVVAIGSPDEIVTKELMHELYGVEVIVKNDEEIGKFIVPLGVR